MSSHSIDSTRLLGRIRTSATSGGMRTAGSCGLQLPTRTSSDGTSLSPGSRMRGWTSRSIASETSFGIWRASGITDGKPADGVVLISIPSSMPASMTAATVCCLALEVIQTLKEDGFIPLARSSSPPSRNEEGVRYAPDMMGSLVYAGGLARRDRARHRWNRRFDALEKSLTASAMPVTERTGFL